MWAREARGFWAREPGTKGQGQGEQRARGKESKGIEEEGGLFCTRFLHPHYLCEG